jgi:hypothetical protein
MMLTTEKVFSAFIALVIALAGALCAWQWFHHGAFLPVILLLTAVVTGFAADQSAKWWLLPKHPVGAAWTLEFWVLFPVSLGISAVAAIIIAAVHFKIAEKTGLSKEVTSGIVGAFSTFLSTLFVKSAEDADANWSAAHTKKAFYDAYSEYPFTDPAGERWVFSDTYGGVSGWGLKARHERARNINNYI